MNISYKKIEPFFHNVLTKIKVKKNDRELLIRSLVGSSLRGVDSHGIRLFSHYVHCLEQGRIKKNPKMKIIKKKKGIALYDADDGLGHVAALKASKIVSSMAKQNGIAAIGIVNSSHYGAAGVYSLVQNCNINVFNPFIIKKFGEKLKVPSPKFWYSTSFDFDTIGKFWKSDIIKVDNYFNSGGGTINDNKKLDCRPNAVYFFEGHVPLGVRVVPEGVGDLLEDDQHPDAGEHPLDDRAREEVRQHARTGQAHADLQPAGQHSIYFKIIYYIIWNKITNISNGKININNYLNN